MKITPIGHCGAMFKSFPFRRKHEDKKNDFVIEDDDDCEEDSQFLKVQPTYRCSWHES